MSVETGSETVSDTAAQTADRSGRIGLWHGITPFAVAAELLDPGSFQVTGDGAWVTDQSGRRYLDARSGMWNVALGYSADRVVEAISAQARRLPSGVAIRFEQPPQVSVDYADKLLDHVGGAYSAVKLYQSGAQAVEGAVLLARYLNRALGKPERSVIVSLRDSWHGAGAAAGAVTGEPAVHSACGPLLDGVSHVEPPYCHRCPFGASFPGCAMECVAAIARRIDEIGADRVAAVIVEPVLGTKIITPPDGYLPALAEICRERGVLFIVDEITTGFGRTGALALSVQAGIEADILLLGKGISAGYLPLTAMLIGDRLSAELLDSPAREGFPHGSTSDGYPIGAAAGSAVLDTFVEQGVLANVELMGSRLRAALDGLAARHPALADVRGRGLMLGVEFEEDGEPWAPARMSALRFACESEGLLVHTGANVLDLMPPLIITEHECDEIVARLDRALTAIGPGW